MPDTKTRFSGFTSSSGNSSCTAVRIESSPHPGHQRTSWSDWKSLRLSFTASSGIEHLLDPGFDLGRRERDALDLAQRLRVDQVLGTNQARQLPEVHLGD